MEKEYSLIQMKNISIEFPGVKALKGVDFSIEAGKISALVGANGAGKSTLMKILSGVYPHYTGEILIDDEKRDIHSPNDATDFGISIVYQEVDTALIPYLSVAENIMINRLSNMKWVDHGKIRADATKLLNRLNVSFDTGCLVSSLTLAQKQLVLIARALSSKCKFLLLDEPTAPLSQTETKELFRVVRDLSKDGVGVVFISHRLPEVFEICEEITILKDGENVTKQKTTDLDIKQVVMYMLDRNYEETYCKQDVSIGQTIFEIKDLTEKSGLIKDINLSVRSGEIVGITGLVGAGKTELCKTIFGALPHSKGVIQLNGKEIKSNTPYKAVNNGLALVPEERRKEGILVEESVLTNLTISSLQKFCNLFSFIKFDKEKTKVKEIIRETGIKTPSEQQKTAYLSGGNQQKVAVSKWLIADAEVYLFDEPTKGIDIGAKQDMFKLIERLASEGKGIIYATCEASEIIGITDRVYVMYGGSIVAEMDSKDLKEEDILYYSAGGK